MEQRVWIKSGIVEELDAKQTALLKLVLEKIQYYYRHLYRTQPRYRFPLSLSRLMKLCNRSGSTITLALRYHATRQFHSSVRVGTSTSASSRMQRTLRGRCG